MQRVVHTQCRSARSRLKDLGHRIWMFRAIYAILLPGLLWYLIFAYGPMGGLMLAFKTYKANLGILGSPWAGLDNYIYVFRDPAFIRAIQRTLSINIGRILFQFPVPIILALLINEVRYSKFKKIVQTIYTFPHFLSWVIVAGILTNIMVYNGLINNVISALGGSTINFLGNEKIFVPLLYITESWKSAGWSAIIYLAAISGIDVNQYEAAQIDGANRFQQVIRITIPNLLPTITVMFILSVGNLMNAGFDQIFNLSNAAVKSVAEILDIYIYRVTFQAPPDFSFSMAVSLFRSIVNMVLLFLADRGAKMLGGDGLFA